MLASLANLANLATVSTVLYWGQANGYVAQALGVPPYVLVGYCGARTYVFYGRTGRSLKN